MPAHPGRPTHTFQFRVPIIVPLNISAGAYEGVMTAKIVAHYPERPGVFPTPAQPKEVSFRIELKVDAKISGTALPDEGGWEGLFRWPIGEPQDVVVHLRATRLNGVRAMGLTRIDLGTSGIGSVASQ
jgi:hypothetical protein